MDDEDILTQYWEAIGRADGKTMATCYAEDATFSDVVFPNLEGPEIGRMWMSLMRGQPDLVVRTHPLLIEHDEAAGTHIAEGVWEADYLFTPTGRKVHNVIRSRITAKGGAIIHHEDSFRFWRWSRQALGPVGWLLGWTPMMRKKVQAVARKRLHRA